MQSIKKISLCFLILLLASSAKTKVYADGGPNPLFTGNAGSEVSGTYTITIKKIEISVDGNAWVTLGDSTQDFNIAGYSIGDSVGSYISNNSVPAGTYNYLRITQSRTMTIKGRSGDQDSGPGVLYYYTSTQNGAFNGFYKAGSTTSAWDNDNPPSDYEAVSFQVPDGAIGMEGETLTLTATDMVITKNLSATPIIISEGATKGMVMSFNTQSMIGFESADTGYIFYPLPPRSAYSEE